VRSIKAKWTEQGKVPDLPDGERFPEIGDPHVFGICTGDNEWIIYETEDELPAASQERFRLLRDLPDDLPLWRYMDFPRLYYLVSQQSLHFTPTYILREAEPYEFRLPNTLQDQLRQRFYYEFESASWFNDPAMQKHYLDAIIDPREGELFSTGISCWHINETENNALWSTYTPGGGIAIKTTLGRLKASLDCGRRHVLADIVEYIDYRTEGFVKHPSAEGFEPYFHKAKFFEYEKEFRLMCRFDANVSNFLIQTIRRDTDYDPTREVDNEYLLEGRRNLKAAVAFPVNLSTLICDVVIGPPLGMWLRDLIVDLLKPILSSGTPIRASDISRWIEE
jgi:hypothetical protein